MLQKIVGVEGNLTDFFDFIREDPNNYYPNTDEGREQFLARQRELVAGIYEKVDTYFNMLPKAELEVRRVEPFRENTAGIAFYNMPSADGSRPGVYYTNLRDMTTVQKYVHTGIAYHESAPGHHFQLALQQEMESLPSFRKYGGFGSYIEGWGLYAEFSGPSSNGAPLMRLSTSVRILGYENSGDRMPISVCSANRSANWLRTTSALVSREM